MAYVTSVKARFIDLKRHECGHIHGLRPRDWHTVAKDGTGFDTIGDSVQAGVDVDDCCKAQTAKGKGHSRGCPKGFFPSGKPLPQKALAELY